MASCDELRAKHSSHDSRCIVPRCGQRACTVIVPRHQSMVVKCDECDAFQQDEQRPDFIIFWDDIQNHRHVWLILEIKGGVKSGRTMFQQAERGASVVEHHPLFSVPQPRTRFLVPLILFDGKSRAASFTENQRKSVLFFGTKYPVAMLRCRPDLTLLHLLP